MNKIEKLLDLSPRILLNSIQTRLASHTSLNDFDSKHPCIFVLSTGRTGTQTLANLFGLSLNVLSHHEPKPKLFGLSKLLYQNSDHWLNCKEVWQEAFWMARIELLSYALELHRGYIETSPQATFLAPVIISVIPRAKFIHLVRDPRYVVRSGMRRKWYGGNPADKTRIVPNPATEVGVKWENYSLFEKNLWLWAETNRKIEEFLQKLPEQQKLIVTSEKIFDNNHKAIEGIFAFIESSPPQQSKVMRVLQKKFNRQRTGKFIQVDEWDENMMSILRSITGDLAMRYGYALDDRNRFL